MKGIRASHFKSRAWLGALILCTGSMLAGCCIPIPGAGSGGSAEGRTTHHLIIGIGLVSCGDAADGAVIATKAQALGVSASDRPGLRLGIGYSSSTVVSVQEGAEDVRVEVSDRPGGPLKLEGASFKLKSNPKPKEE